MNTMRSVASLSLFGALFSNIIIGPADVVGQPQTCSDERHCQASNDPHFTTWDSFYFDNHASGVLQYLTSCVSGDFSIATGVPFQVSALQGPCSTGSTAACLEEIYIYVEDGTTITYVNNDPLLQPSPPAGSFSTANTNYVTSNGLFEGNFIDVDGQSVHFEVDIQQHVVVITASECILDAMDTNNNNNVCGLCGTPDNDPSNDFTVTNGETGEHEVLEEQNVENAHAFGDAWCQDGDCLTGTDISTIFEATDECLEIAGACCQDIIWPMKCMEYCEDMMAMADADMTENYEEWVKNWENNCAFDGCAMTDNNFDDIGCENAIVRGFFDASIQVCEKVCEMALEQERT